ncbi:MAG: ACT domain-containing protein [Chitinophagaceae bacterium]
MAGEINLSVLLKTMTPELNEGDYVFCVVDKKHDLKNEEIICSFREKEGTTIIISKAIADRHKLAYSYVAAWITLTVHSSLDAVGLTAAFSKALAEENISCNVVAAYYHDHIFVATNDAAKAMEVLRKLSVSF